MVVLLGGADVLDESLVGAVVVAGGLADLGRNAQALYGAAEYLVEGLVGEAADGVVDGEAVFVQDGLNLPEYHAALPLAQGHDGSVVDGEAAVGDDEVAVDERDVAQALAARTGALGGVEREVVGCGVGVRDAAGGAHQAAAVVAYLLGLDVVDHHEAVALLEGVLDAVLQAAVVGLLDDEAVHDDFDGVVAVAVELHAPLHLHQFAVDANVEVALLQDRFEEFFVVSLAVFDERGQEIDLAPEIVVEQEVDDLFLGVLDHALAGDVGKGFAGTGIEQAEEVVDFRCGAHGGAGVLVRGLLLDADDGREAGYLVDIGAFHVAQEVAGVGREGLDVATLSLGKDGVEGQAGLARTGEACDDGEAASGDGDVDVL